MEKEKNKQLKDYEALRDIAEELEEIAVRLQFNEHEKHL